MIRSRPLPWQYQHLILSLHLLLSVLLICAGETLNLCTNEIPNLVQIRPSETTTHDIPNITINDETYFGDHPHFIVRPPLRSHQTYQSLFVLILGTKGRAKCVHNRVTL